MQEVFFVERLCQTIQSSNRRLTAYFFFLPQNMFILMSGQVYYIDMMAYSVFLNILGTKDKCILIKIKPS